MILLAEQVCLPAVPVPFSDSRVPDAASRMWVPSQTHLRDRAGSMPPVIADLVVLPNLSDPDRRLLWLGVPLALGVPVFLSLIVGWRGQLPTRACISRIRREFFCIASSTLSKVSMPRASSIGIMRWNTSAVATVSPMAV